MVKVKRKDGTSEWEVEGTAAEVAEFFKHLGLGGGGSPLPPAPAHR